ncbi:MAG TPA: RbsD/FucU domain-containing protein [Arenibaculum sp.]|nr:RbsD/FucU domain-containing protein [Arenibaculum sp.]
MLKGLDPLLNSALLSVLADMGHGDDIAVVDANYPAASGARRLVRHDGASATDVLRAVLSVMPVDDFVDDPAAVMACPDATPPIVGEFKALLEHAEARPVTLTQIERFAFYERARNAYAIVITGERRLYGNVIVKKGVVRPEAGTS